MADIEEDKLFQDRKKHEGVSWLTSRNLELGEKKK